MHRLHHIDKENPTQSTLTHTQQRNTNENLDIIFKFKAYRSILSLHYGDETYMCVIHTTLLLKVHLKIKDIINKEQVIFW